MHLSAFRRRRPQGPLGEPQREESIEAALHPPDVAPRGGSLLHGVYSLLQWGSPWGPAAETASMGRICPEIGAIIERAEGEQGMYPGPLKREKLLS